MSCYFVANIRMKNPFVYAKYLEKCDEVFAKYDGKYLAVNENPEVLEGEYKYSKVVIIEFKNQNDLKHWYYSRKYQEIVKFRLEGAHCDAIIVDGNT